MGVPFQFPDIHLPPDIAPKARWLNFCYRGDIIAYPLKRINEAYGKSVSKDILLGLGNYLNNWNPLSHNYYWKSHDMLEQVATFLATF